MSKINLHEDKKSTAILLAHISGKNLGLSSDIETLPQLAVQNSLITSKVIGIGSELPAVETARKDVGVDYAIESTLLAGKPLDSSVPDVVAEVSKPLIVNDSEASRVLGNGKVLTDSISDVVSVAASPKFNNTIIVRSVSSGKDLGLSNDIETLDVLAEIDDIILAGDSDGQDGTCI
jgi:hypothetical protein